MSKTFAPYVESSKSEAPAAEEMLDRVVCSRPAANSSVFRCALKVVIVAELFAYGDREFQTAGAVILKALCSCVQENREGIACSHKYVVCAHVGIRDSVCVSTSWSVSRHSNVSFRTNGII